MSNNHRQPPQGPPPGGMRGPGPGGRGPMMRVVEKPKNFKGGLLRLLKYLKPYRLLLICLILCIVLETFFNSLVSLVDIGFIKRRRIRNNVSFIKKYIVNDIPDITETTDSSTISEVADDFNCSHCPKLESLEGAPRIVRNFDCSICISLKTLKGG